MRQSLNLPGGILFVGLGAVLAVLHLVAPVRACTIFVLTDARHVLFCNNEDHPNPKTRIWFVPAGEGYYGAVYVGTDSGFAQGGLNTEGLAFDWVAGHAETWQPDPCLPYLRGNSSQRMLETCATVDDVLAFFQTNREPGFSFARILVADRTGASIIIGPKDGRLQFERDNRTRGFGFGRQTLASALAKRPKPTTANGLRILRDCRQGGNYTTRYSNVFDLKSGDIFLRYFPNPDDPVKLNLAVELPKGAHYYDMPQIHRQLAQAPRPSMLNMRRFPLDEAQPLVDQEPNVTTHLRAMIQEASEGRSHADDFTPEMWRRISALPKASQADLQRFGELASMTLVDRREEDGQRVYYYRVEFAHAMVLQQFILDGQNRLASGNLWVDVVWKPGFNGGVR